MIPAGEVARENRHHYSSGIPGACGAVPALWFEVGIAAGFRLGVVLRRQSQQPPGSGHVPERARFRQFRRGPTEPLHFQPGGHRDRIGSGYFFTRRPLRRREIGRPKTHKYRRTVKMHCLSSDRLHPFKVRERGCHHYAGIIKKCGMDRNHDLGFHGRTGKHPSKFSQ